MLEILNVILFILLLCSLARIVQLHSDIDMLKYNEQALKRRLKRYKQRLKQNGISK
ncbi:hypothetical protein NW133_07270 [Staphylococcus pettenkoferi]|uniref:DUF1514 domain-containing protein n=1 Tax=Staphylococcus pettenkoferi TaxID=170573 RepID=A0ABT4BN01_9STAP|nr:hypothetical protein [Staphylococcus pettenkoferi]MCY1563842.1 hypothetical protein [Staphylococcus pettenkoferi]MCY1583327.1 hypothetical protein [Staphylococcus pettenkoferi]